MNNTYLLNTILSLAYFQYLLCNNTFFPYKNPLIYILFYLHFTDLETEAEKISQLQVCWNPFVSKHQFKTSEATLEKTLEECHDHSATIEGLPTSFNPFTLMLYREAVIKSGCLWVHLLKKYFIPAL